MSEIKPNKIYVGDCRKVMRKWKKGQFDMCITSPPYWSQRDYKTIDLIWNEDKNCEHEWNEIIKKASHGKDFGKPKKIISLDYDTKSNYCPKCGAWKGSLGLEPNPYLFVKHLCDIFDQVRRVLKPYGTLWVNLGDSYNGSGGAGSQYSKWRKRHTQFGKVVGGEGQSFPTNLKNYPKKSLLFVPFRFAIEMVDRGWICRNVINWNKPNPIPSSSKDKYTVDFEYLFFFAKSNKRLYYYNKKTKVSQYIKPKSTKGIEGKDWDWTVNEKGKTVKRSYWISRDYHFKQQFDKYKESYLADKRIGTVVPPKHVKTGYEEVGAQDPTIIRNRIHKKGLGIGSNKKTTWKLDYNLKYGNTDMNAKSIGHYSEKIRSESREKAKILFPNNPKKQQEYINFVHDHGEGIRNKRTTWNISTAQFKGAHFAVFPIELTRSPIDAGCPKYVCKKCGLPREVILEHGKLIESSAFGGSNKHKGYKNPTYSGKEGYRTKIATGLSDCGCGVGFESGVVLDPFGGAGTTALESLNQGKKFVIIELNKTYAKIAYNRIKGKLGQRRLM